MPRSIWSFATAGTLRFGEGAAQRVHEIVAAEGYRRTALISDRTLLEAGMVDIVARSLPDFSNTTYLFEQAEPPVAVAVEAADVLKRFSPDAIIGVGGGSAMDLAKIVAVLLTHGGEPRDWFGFGKVPASTIPVIAVPTTAGTGSEVSHSAVLTDAAGAMKVSTLSPWLRPTYAVVDPQMTWSCPPRLTAETGLDALTHAVEAFIVRPFSELDGSRESTRAYQGKAPLTDALAKEAIERIFRYLPRAVANGRDEEARREVALASTLAGMAFSNAGVSLVHALEYPLGGAGLCSHGLGNGMLLPYVVAALAPYREAELAQLARLIGVVETRAPADEASRAFVHALFDLQRTVGIPTKLREIGAREEDLAEYARKASTIERLCELASCPTDAETLTAMLRSAW
jgi:alcohol dehydrogenase class IV